MSTVKATNFQNASSATANMVTDASGNVSFGGTAAMSSSFLRNRIINGDMRVDQRNAGALVAIADSTVVYITDRFRFDENTDGSFSGEQDTDAPTGFTNSLKLLVTSADTSLAAGQYANLRHLIEGFNISDFSWGTANAKSVTLSFWVRSSLTGTFGGSVRDSASNYSYPFTYTISVANTWENKTVTIAGPTAGTWNTDNTVGLSLVFGLGVGSTFSGTAGAWAVGNYLSATGATSVVGTNGATWYVTGVQLEVGTVATPFERQIYSNQLAQCQRYYQVLGKGLNGSPAYEIFSILTYETSTTAWGIVPLKVTMRTQPTTTYSGTFTTSYGTQGPLLNDTNQTGPDNGVLGWGAGSGGTTGYATYLRASNSTAAFISFSAEL